MAAALIACDWGSTTLRAWAMDADWEVVASCTFPYGVNGLAAGEAPARFAEVRAALDAPDIPAVLCGAIGSNLGWREAPYADCPARLEDVAARMIEAEPGVWIAPGLRCDGLDGAGDVLRGEETMALGWLYSRTAGEDVRYVVCLPGTHSKWIVIERMRVTRFLSAFTGELFDLLTKHSILRGGDGDDPEAFVAGLAAAGEGDALLTRLFTARSRVAGGGAPPQTTSAYLSGLLIGAEVAATPRLLDIEGDLVTVVGERAARDRYIAALDRRGIPNGWVEGGYCVRSGLFMLARSRGFI
jgi:2-dehydro-3-deoxygalactonokinase